jgi:ABC-type antimicrobial peptide transport system permease subunit
MNGHYLKIALRRIFRNYKSTFIIFIGLVIGLTSCLIIYTKVKYELSFDSSHSESKNIFRVVRVTSGLEYTEGGLEYRTGVYFPFPAEIRRNIPELKNVSAMFYSYGAKISVPSGDNTIEKTFVLDNGIVFTEPSFFEIFDYGHNGINWMNGPGKKVLEKPFTAVITKETAGRLFLNQDPIGKDINVFGTKFTVEGVIEDLPENSDFPFKVFLSLTTLYEKLIPGSLTDWGSLSDNYQCYVVLNKTSNIAEIEQKFKDVYTPHAYEDYAERRRFKLQPLAQVHKEAKFGNYNNRTVSSGLILAITLIGAFIFIIACFNYSNFFLAETFKQKKQIALRLIMGSKPASIFLQFFTESLLVNFCALLFSLQLILPIIKNFYQFIDIPKGYIPMLDMSAFFFLLILLFAGGILSIIFSIFNLKLKSLSDLLKKSDSTNSGKENNFGKGSVILQFVVAQTVIIATLVIVKQIYFINHTELGYNTENTIIAPIPGNLIAKLPVLKSELLSIPGVKGVSYSSVTPAESRQWSGLVLFKNEEKKKIDAEVKSIDTTYLKMYSFTLVAGQNFSSQDTAFSIIVNREFLHETGFTNADEALGVKIEGVRNSGAYIKGIVEDFHSGSLHDEIRPCVFINNPGDYRTVNIRLTSSGIKNESRPEVLPGDIEKVNNVWKSVFPDQVFEYSFLSDRIANYYKSEYKALNLFLLFASITILLCVLGILGLSLSMNERRTKEIGLRKVNGATVSEVIVLLNKDFVKWIAIAFVFATPIAWYAMQKWLQNFAYKTEMSWWLFGLAGIMALVIALLTVSLQSLRAATRNPVEALRYE